MCSRSLHQAADDEGDGGGGAAAADAGAAGAAAASVDDVEHESCRAAGPEFQEKEKGEEQGKKEA